MITLTSLSRLHFRRLSVFVLLTVIVVLNTGCATPPEDPEARAEYEQTNDVLEPLNRYFFTLTEVLDFLLVRPLADTYVRTVPETARTKVGNFFSNLGEVRVLINTLLQGRFEDSLTTLGRFAVNSTLGIGGLFDVASTFSLEKQRADFGQTLYTYGVGEGPYLYLPFLGPSNPRDALGSIVDRVLDPFGSGGFGLYPGTIFNIEAIPSDVETVFNRSTLVLSPVHQRSTILKELDTLRLNSLDFYVQLRTISRQLRRSQLGITPQERPFGPQTEDPFYDDSEDPFYDPEDPFYDDSEDPLYDPEDPFYDPEDSFDDEQFDEDENS